jgi:hypothetical protein
MAVVLYWQEGQDIPYFPPPDREGFSANLSVSALFGSETGGFLLHATIQETHQVIINYTENPVEKGRSVTDHSFIQPDELTIDIIVSNDSGNILGGGFVEGLLSDQIYSKDVFEYLEKLAKENVLLIIETPLKIYENMTIREIKVDKNKDTANCLSAKIYFKEISFAYSSETDPLKPAPEKPIEQKEKNKTKPSKKTGKTTAQPVPTETEQAINENMAPDINPDPVNAWVGG